MNNIRIVGSNYTFITWTPPQGPNLNDAPPSGSPSRAGGALAYLQTVEDSGQQAFGSSSFSAIYEIGNSYPVDFVVQETTQPGRLTMSLLDVWDEPAWARLSEAFGGSLNITDVNRAQLGFDTLPQVHIIIQPPAGAGGGNLSPRGKTCHDVLITDISDGESVTIGDMQRTKTIRAVYRYATPLDAGNGLNLSTIQNLANNTYGRGV